MKNIIDKKPLITIVTVTYNAEAFLERTVNSVLEQDYENIEYIIIDGGSSDGTIDIIKKYEKNINYWVSEPDNGLYDAMNKGIGKATGKWINFMNAGDCFASNKVISDIVLAHDNVDIICGPWNLVDSKYKYISTQIPSKLDTTWKRTFCNHQAMFVSTSVMKKYKFDINYKYAAERDLFLKFRRDKISYKIIDSVVCDFLFNDTGFSRTNQLHDAIDALSVISKYIDCEDQIYDSLAYKRLVEQETIVEINNFPKELSNFYTNLINFLEVNKEKRIILYGYGTVSKMILKLSNNLKINIVDLNYLEYIDDGIINPLELKNINFDIIAITVLGRESEIKSYLINDLKIKINKIKTVYKRRE